MRECALMKLKSHTNNMIQYQVSNNNIPIRVIVDLDVNEKPVLVFPQSKEGVASIIVIDNENGNRTYDNVNQNIGIPLYDSEPITDKLNEGGFLVPEFQTLLLFTEEFIQNYFDTINNTDTLSKVENILTQDIKNMEDELDKAVNNTSEDKAKKLWITYLLAMVGFSINAKTKSIQEYAGTQVQRGISRVELEKYQNTLIPLFIIPDTLKLTLSTDYETKMVSHFSDAIYLMGNELNKVFGDKLETHKAVYYQGGRIYRGESSESYTLYIPKMEIIRKGYNSAMEAVFEIGGNLLNNL